MITVASAFARWSTGALGRIAKIGMIVQLLFVWLSIGLTAEARAAENDGFVTIRLSEATNEADLMSFANQRIAVDPGFTPIRLTGNIFRFRLDSGLSRDSALCELRGEGLLVNPVVVLGNDRYLSYADRIVVKPKLGVTETQLAALDSAIGCVALAGAATWPSQYFATVLDSKGRSCIDIAAQYMASGNCVKAYPEEFITPLFTGFPGDLRSLQWPLENRGVGGRVPHSLLWECMIHDDNCARVTPFLFLRRRPSGGNPRQAVGHPANRLTNYQEALHVESTKEGVRHGARTCHESVRRAGDCSRRWPQLDVR